MDTKKMANTKEPILAIILRWLVYSVAFIPLVIWQDYVSPFHFGKAIVLRTLVEIMFTGYVFLILRDRTYLPKVTPIFLTTVLFFVAYAIATIFSFDPFLSMWGSLERMGGLYSLIHIALFFIMACGLLRTYDHWKRMLQFTVIASLLSASYGFLQKTSLEWVLGSGGRSKIFGTLGNPALFAGYMLTSLFLSAGLAITEWKKSNLKYLWLAIAGIGSLAVLMSGVRGSVIALFVGWFIVMIGLGFYAKAKLLTRSAIGIVLFVALAFILIQAFKDTDFIKKSQYLARYADFSFSSYTIQTRTWTWTSGLEGWIESPRAMFMGFGPENFQIPFVKHFNPNHFRGPGSETLFDRAHNMFIEVIVTMGVVGFLIYIALFSSIIQQMWFVLKEKYNERIKGRVSFDDPELVWSLVIIAITIAYCIHNFFIFDTTANYLVILTAFGFASFMRSDSIKSLIAKPLTNTTIALFISGILAIISIYSIYFYNVLPARANYMTTRAVVANWTGKQAEAYQLFKEAIDLDTPITQDLLPKLTQALMEKYSGGDIPKEGVDALIYAFNKHVELSKAKPYDNINPLYAARMAVILGRIEGGEKYNDIALQLAEMALRIAPKFVRTYYELGQIYLNKGDKESALKYFQQAADLSPTAGIGYWYVGNVLLDLGQKEAGTTNIKKSIELGYAPRNEEYFRLAKLFIKNNDIANAVRIYEGLVQNKPDDAQLRANVAFGYAELKMLDEAVVQLREILRIDPKLRADVEAFAKKIGRSL